jgi:hypothetical protein
LASISSSRSLAAETVELQEMSQLTTGNAHESSWRKPNWRVLRLIQALFKQSDGTPMNVESCWIEVGRFGRLSSVSVGSTMFHLERQLCHPNPSPVTPVPPSYPFSGFKSVKLSHEARVAAVHSVPFPEKTGNLLQGVGGNPWKSNSCCTVVRWFWLRHQGQLCGGFKCVYRCRWSLKFHPEFHHVLPLDRDWHMAHSLQIPWDRASSQGLV